MSEQFDESTGTALLHMIEDLKERVRKVEARIDLIERQPYHTQAGDATRDQDTVPNKHGQENEKDEA